MTMQHFHRRFKESFPTLHYCEEWNVHTFGQYGLLENYRVTFKLDSFEKPCFEVSIEMPSGAFTKLNRRTQYKRIKKVMNTLKTEYQDYKYNKNYAVKIN